MTRQFNARYRSATLMVASFLVVSSASAVNVSLKNGNAFTGFTDCVYTGGFEPKIERIYNSKSGYKGRFGWGWGTEYAAQCFVGSDGAVIIKEYGGGATNRFTPVGYKKQHLAHAVQKLIQAAKKAGAAGSAVQVKEYRARLTADALYRNREWKKYVARGLIKSNPIKVGTQLTSNRFSYQYVTRTKEGYVRTYDNGRVERFNNSCALTEIRDKNSNFIQFTYDKSGKMTKLVDNFNRKMFFEYNSLGLVSKAKCENKKVALFKYNKRGQLIASKDADGNKYKYRYDKRHKITQITYADGTKVDVAYYGRKMKENVKRVVDRDGTIREYNYLGRKGNSRLYKGIEVLVKAKGGTRIISKSRYEYFFKLKASGERWHYRLITDLDGDKTETVYNSCCGLPIMIKRNGAETAFEYDPKGRVTKKSTPREITRLAYDPKVGKVTKVVRYSKVTKKRSNWSEFKYDPKGNLTFAKNSDKKAVKLFYDRTGRIKSMVDQSRRRIDFEYNENSKPVRITDPKLGSITVTYDNAGQIQNVKSSSGRRIALQVTSAFQNLLDIIRPAGVTLSF